MLERPARELAVAREPDVWKAADVAHDLLERGDDHRAAAEMAVQRQHEQAHRLVLVQIIERAFVDVEVIARARTQHTVVGEIRSGHRGDGAVPGLNNVGEIGVSDVTVPLQPRLRADLDGVRSEGEHRAEPSARALGAGGFEKIDAAADGGALLFRRHVGKEPVLGIAVRRDVVARARDLLYRFGIDLSALRVDAEGAWRLQAVERAHDAPYADAAAVRGPCLGAVVYAAGLERGGLHRVARRLAFGPGLEHHRDGHGDSRAVGPRQRLHAYSPS